MDTGYCQVGGTQTWTGNGMDGGTGWDGWGLFVKRAGWMEWDERTEWDGGRHGHGLLSSGRDGRGAPWTRGIVKWTGEWDGGTPTWTGALLSGRTGWTGGAMDTGYCQAGGMDGGRHGHGALLSGRAHRRGRGGAGRNGMDGGRAEWDGRGNGTDGGTAERDGRGAPWGRGLLLSGRTEWDRGTERDGAGALLSGRDGTDGWMETGGRAWGAPWARGIVKRMGQGGMGRTDGWRRGNGRGGRHGDGGYC